METVRTTIRLPKTFPLLVKEGDMEQFIRRSLAVELYRERAISLGKAAELAGVKNTWEMLLLLNKKGVPIDYSPEDVEEDVATLERSG